MFHTARSFVGLVAGWSLWIVASVGWSEESIEFEKQVAPILRQHCVRCHGAEKLEAGLDVRRRFTLLKGGDSGAAIVAGKPEESLLWQRVEKNEMPPPEEKPLDAAQKKILREWLATGARLTRDPEPPLDSLQPTSRVTAEDRSHWSFQPPVRKAPPTAGAETRVRSPVDAWLREKLTAEGLAFNVDADRRRLLRRLTLGLWGLPPTWEQWEAFQADSGPDAVERLVDRLLASPRYGERWGRRWLDVAGYADSDGYLAADRVRPEAWRYRDYVIDSLNADLPYDQFVREQLAGDELSEWRQADQLSPEMNRQLVATGFLRTASDPTYPGYTEPNEIHQVLSDTMQIVGSSFLGLTIQCARCHAHKFDPLSQRDYYALQAIFLPALDPARWQPSEVRGIPWATEPQLARIAQHNQQIDAKIAQWQREENELTSKYRIRRIAELWERFEQPITDSFDALGLDPGWIVSRMGTTTGWRGEGSQGEFQIHSIDGGKGYALVRLSRPVLLEGEFRAKLVFRWKSSDTDPKSNKAMQGVMLQARDATNNLLASAGYIDENNTARGSPITGVATGNELLGADLVAHYVKKHQQAIPPSPRARSLSPSGKATVTLERDAGGMLRATYDDGQTVETVVGENRGRITALEVELRRYVLENDATFEGIWLEEFQSETGTANKLPVTTRSALHAALELDEGKRNAEQKKLIAEYGPLLAAAKQDLSARFPEFAAESDRLQAAVKSEAARKETTVKLRGVVDIDGPVPDGRVLVRGDYDKPGATLNAGVPEVLSSQGGTLAVTASYKTSGRRRALAEWLTDPSHPLLARVQVNRLWSGHFGRALVETPSNFGKSGAKPSHPELLDWLATELIQREWSLKSMHRLLVTSTAYRQGDEMSERQRRLDPENRWYGAWTPRRMDGETLRDSLLAVSGKLNQRMRGTPSPVAAQGDGSVLTADDAAGNRRSIYLMVRRSQHVTMLDLFDTPAMEVNCLERNTSTVPLQALALLHGPFADQNAKVLGESIVAAAADDRGRITWALRHLYTRDPAAKEFHELTAFLEAVRAVYLKANGASTAEQRLAADRAAYHQLALVLLNENEFLYE